jgi:phosphopantothenoylcysteine decarboxylase/phosphopantothenate--cysteine ligase
LGVKLVPVTTAAEMLEAVNASLPADAAIFAAAVADWRLSETNRDKIKKSGSGPPSLKLAENPDILKSVALGASRPALVIGFAAETADVLQHAKKKLRAKGADWIIANDVSPDSGVMGGERNAVHILTREGVESWPEMTKAEVARRLMARVAADLANSPASAE